MGDQTPPPSSPVASKGHKDDDKAGLLENGGGKRFDPGAESRGAGHQHRLTGDGRGC